MIGFLEGILFRKEVGRIIVLTGGVGYQVAISFQTYCSLPQTGEPVSLEIYHHVKEDRSELYGFSFIRGKELFEKLISVSGIGPKTALGVLSPHPAGEVAAAIDSEDISFLTRIPGIGKKTAQRVILELKGKLAHDESEIAEASAGVPGFRDDALSALVNLGYKKSQAEKVVDAVLLVSQPEDFEDMMKKVFDQIGGG
ncbi:MAG: Holliday junction branch migration protein RuvA [Acidobacteria bacterium]|nr:Holliday junction branch migration protein RuvA [Acidobacteriota bacterium]